MKRPCMGAGLLKWLGMMLIAFQLMACAGEDKPFTLVSDTNEGGTVPNPGTGNPPPGGGTEGCFVNFNGTMQLKVSAEPANGPPLNKLDANPVTIDPIPLKVDGGNISIIGDQFPEIILTTVSASADLRISGVNGVEAKGTYDAASGKIEIKGMQFALEILNKGTTERFIDGEEKLTNITLTTDSVTATGNLNSITEDGAPLSASDKSIVLVGGLTLPTSFPSLPVLDNMIGGGALTARFEGSLDSLPENCTSGGGTPPPGGGGSGGTAGPTDFAISDGTKSNTGEINFGTTPVLVTKDLAGNTILDCREAANRGIVTKPITIKNSGTGELKIKIPEPADNDNDNKKDPGCSGKSEFVRGSVTIKGAATCETVTVGGKQFLTGTCTIPTGDANSVSFPLMYQPFNFVATTAPAPEPVPTPTATPAPSGPTTTTVADTGNLVFEYNDGKTFVLKLTGKSEPDTRDVFSISKVKEGVISNKEIPNKGLIKVAIQNSDPKPYTQKLVLKNDGTDSWEEVTFALGDASSVFSVPAPATTTVPPSGGTDPGKLEFDLVFNPGAEASYNDILTITLVKTGSKTADNPEGTKTILTYNLLGTVGLPVLKGNVKFQIDFMAAKIDHSVTVDPIESLDFRAHPEQAPPPLDLELKDTSDDSVKEVVLHVENKDVLDKTKAERINSLRILNAQATWGTPNRKLIPGEGSDLCHEPNNVKQPYENSRMECSYFYFNIFGDTSGIYDDESGHLTVPEITLRIQNPYHSDIASKWPKSNWGANPDYLLDTPLAITLTTHLLDQINIEEAGEELVLVPDTRITKGQLNVKGKSLGLECPEDIFDHEASGTIEAKHPHIKCYLSSDGKYLQGKEVQLRPNQTKEYDVVMVGVGHYPSDTIDPELPWFMGEDGGSRMYIAIQGRLFIE